MEDLRRELKRKNQKSLRKNSNYKKKQIYKKKKGFSFI